MYNLSLLAIMGGKLWYALPLVIVVSLVYSATRAETTEMILTHTVRTLVWITSFMLVVFAILFVLSRFV